jgi:limonene-1,2-epoxide hydrolase
MPTPEQIVRDFCATASSVDVAKISAFFTDDVVYQNMPLEPSVGKAAVVADITGQLTMFNSFEWEITHIAANGNVVLTERIDYLGLVTGGRIALPVMGIFELDGDKIKAWRDYFDLGVVTKLITEATAG